MVAAGGTAGGFEVADGLEPLSGPHRDPGAAGKAAVAPGCGAEVGGVETGLSRRGCGFLRRRIREEAEIAGPAEDRGPEVAVETGVDGPENQAMAGKGSLDGQLFGVALMPERKGDRAAGTAHQGFLGAGQESVQRLQSVRGIGDDGIEAAAEAVGQRFPGISVADQNGEVLVLSRGFDGLEDPRINVRHPEPGRGEIVTPRPGGEKGGDRKEVVVTEKQHPTAEDKALREEQGGLANEAFGFEVSLIQADIRLRSPAAQFLDGGSESRIGGGELYSGAATAGAGYRQRTTSAPQTLGQFLAGG